MSFNIKKEEELEYLIQVQCMDCKAAQTFVTKEEDLAQMTKKNALFFGPCPGCGAAFLRVMSV